MSTPRKIEADLRIENGYAVATLTDYYTGEILGTGACPAEGLAKRSMSLAVKEAVNELLVRLAEGKR